jgi:AcrR family transcriptional regulator
MARKTLADDELLDRLLELFRERGYEGVSLSELSEATGLEKASLYYRFPGGKADMVEAVLGHVDRWLAAHVIAPLQQSHKSPAARVRATARNLGKFYCDGRSSCVVNTLSLQAGETGPRKHVRASAKAVLDAFAAVARESGMRPAMARRRAEEALVDIQGALVLARAVGDRAVFRRVIHRLPSQLTSIRPVG